MSDDWAFPASLRPKNEDFRFDVDAALESMVLLRAEIPDDAFTASILGTERVGMMTQFLRVPAGRAPRFLDVGCSTGFVVEAAKSAGWAAIGIDLNPSAVEYGQSRGLDLRTVALEAGGFAPASFDAIGLFDVVEHLLDRYGSLATDVLALLDERPDLVRPLAGAPSYLAIEVVYAVRAEAALHLEDVLARRTRISFETVHRGAESVADTAALMGAELGWSTSRRRREIELYLARVEAERESQTMPDDESADSARLGAPDIRTVPAARS